jgi:hypothetical protein
MKREYIRWAIAGECGLYVGQQMTRQDAIAEHVAVKYGVSPYVSHRLDEAQSEAWGICKKKGDSCGQSKDHPSTLLKNDT